MAIASINPATGETLRAFEPHATAEVERRVALAASLFRRWRATSFAERAARLLRAADLLESRKQEWGRIMTLEMGKPIGAATPRRKSAPGSATTTPRTPSGSWPTSPSRRDASRSFVRYDPLGPCPGGDALELPLLAGVPLRRAGADGRQRGAAQARLQRARSARWPSRSCSATRASRRAPSRTLLVGSKPVRGAHRRPAHRGGHAHRQRAGGPGGGRGGAARRSRSRCWSWAAATRSSCWPTPTSSRPPRRRSGAHHQQRAVLHRGQALHRRRRRSYDAFLEQLRRSP